MLTGLPAGKFVINAKTQLDLGGDRTPVKVECTLEAGAFTDNSAVTLIPISGMGVTATIPLQLAAELSSGDVPLLSCQGNSVFASRVKLTAIQVDTLLFEP